MAGLPSRMATIAPMRVTPTAEPIQPEAPVTKMRTESLLGRALGARDARRNRRGPKTDAIQSHERYHTYAIESHQHVRRCDPVASLRM